MKVKAFSLTNRRAWSKNSIEFEIVGLVVLTEFGSLRLHV